MSVIKNPILKGFHPDPSIIRVNDDYYVATSTFEWFPGVMIHHSKDLCNWRPLNSPLNRESLIDLRGIPSSGGVWAPCLSYSNDTYFLAYSNVKNHDGLYWHVDNYLTTTKDIQGQWSDPIFLHSEGFDPSFFHDEDGRTWLVFQYLNYGESKEGIKLQEFSLEKKELIGPVSTIFTGSKLGSAEGPHLYKMHGYYYLIVAEGGTGLGHAVTVARSHSIWGPYEVDPATPLMSSRDNPLLQLQKAGHADLVNTPAGEWYMVHLVGRPLPSRGLCTLGRETAIQKVLWNEEGWLCLAHGGSEPAMLVEPPMLQEHPWPLMPSRDHFDELILNPVYQTLRISLGQDKLSLVDRPGYLRLKGRDMLNSLFQQSFVARRVGSFHYTAITCLEFEPTGAKQMAGLTCYYNDKCFHYLRISLRDGIGKCLDIVTSDNGIYHFPIGTPVSLNNEKRIYLRANVKYDQLQYSYSCNSENWIIAGPILDAGILSDEYANGWAFTGSFVGICCQDLSGRGGYADFDYFEYVEHEE
ncbi:MAG: glycoside hydrolase family 43 protein [Gorillibacterium sp.]|nr:glycoside hydrolase family 43 protein [Gorillibacterium sp.]